MTNERSVTASLCLLLLLALSVPAVAEDSDAELAKQLQNPIASSHQRSYPAQLGFRHRAG